MPSGCRRCGLQLIGHHAVPQLFLYGLRALCCAAGGEVVAVGGVGAQGEGVAVLAGVACAGVEAVVQLAGAVLLTYEAAHFFLAVLRRGVERSLDEAVGEGNLTVMYPSDHAR